MSEMGKTNMKLNHVSPHAGSQKRCEVTTLQFVCYVAVWVSLFFLIPEGLTSIYWVGRYTEFIGNIIPSVRGYAMASSVPNAALVFWSIQWSLVPIYFFLWSRCFLQNIPEAIRKTKGQAGIGPFGLMLFCVVFAGAIIFLPQEVKTDPRTVHLPAGWDRLMYDYQAIAGVTAVLIPIVFSLLLLFVAGFLKYQFSSSEKSQ